MILKRYTVQTRYEESEQYRFYLNSYTIARKSKIPENTRATALSQTHVSHTAGHCDKRARQGQGATAARGLPEPTLGRKGHQVPGTGLPEPTCLYSAVFPCPNCPMNGEKTKGKRLRSIPARAMSCPRGCTRPPCPLHSASVWTPIPSQAVGCGEGQGK